LKRVFSLLLLMGLVVGACIPAPATTLPPASLTIVTAATPASSAALLPWSELDRRWGAYLPEREWGNPREALNGDGWGVDWIKAVSTRYRHGEDGIAGISDDQGERQFAWAFWDGKAGPITERLNGATNPAGEYGETVYENRLFKEATPTHSYLRYLYRYPYQSPQFEIELITAKVDARSLIAQATVKRLGDGGTARLYLLPKAWFHTGDAVTRLSDRALDLVGEDSHVVLLADQPAQHWQIAQNEDVAKAQFNLSLVKQQALSDGGAGNMGMFEYDLDLAPGQTATVKLALAEADTTNRALANAQAALDRFDEAIALRQSEAQAMYRAEVSQHQDLYQSALQNLLWNEMFYAYDGSLEPAWQGKIAFKHVLIVPDKWEFPWLAGWDTGFQAVAAIHADLDLAKQQLRLVLGDGWQTSTGHVPCTEWSLITECPPVFAWAARQIFQVGGDKEFLAEIFPRLEQIYTYWTRAVQVRKQNLYAGGFMGMDNIPRGAEGSPQADASAWMAWFARDMAELADALGKAERAEYYRAQFSAIAQAINDSLWDPATQFYYDCADKDCTALLKTKSLTGLIPLIAGVAPPDRLEEVMAHLANEKEFWSSHGVRSLSADEAIYEPGYSQSGFKNSNWRGPIWIPINYLLVQTLNGIDSNVSDQLRANLIKTVEDQWLADGRFHEYYDAETGAGLGADHQTGWTALIANLIYEKYKLP
jgi:hypothetical protein